MINDTTNDLTRDDEPIAIEETPEQVEVERKGFSLAKSLRSPRTLISFFRDTATTTSASPTGTCPC